ncbi:MAG: lipopolysaccharide heptosyltransferase II [Elusimicrobiota bacterium]
MSPKILVIRLSSLGDVVLTGPVYKNLKAHWPDARICVMVKPQFAAVLEGHPGVDQVMPFAGLFDALGKIRGGGFTHLLDLQGTLRSRLIRRLSGVANQAVYRKDALARRLFVAFGTASPSLQRHTVDRYLEALAQWDVPVAPERELSPADWGSSRGGASAAKNVLVLQTSFLGDSLLTLPLLRRLKDGLPGARLSVLTLPKNADVFRNNAWVDDVILDDKRGGHSGLAGIWRISAELKRGNFDLAVIPHRSFRSALVARLAGIPRRVGFASSSGRFLLTDAVPFTWLTHDLERNLALAKPLGAESKASRGEARYIVPAPPSAALNARLAAAGIAPGARLAGVHPGAAWATKRWLPERFAELCRRLKADGLTPVLIGGPGDAALGSRIAADSGAADMIGGTDLSELKSLMGRLALFVTNDSGPMHLAAAAGVPVVAIFGATTRELGFFPYGEGHRVVEAELGCRPCGLHGAKICPEGHFLCMRLLTVDQVHRACREALAAAAARSGA